MPVRKDCFVPADEQRLIHEAKSGSHEAFRSLVERYMKHAYNVAYSFVNDHDDAEDVAQEAFVRTYRSLHFFRGDSEFSTWLYRIVTNVSLNRLKQKKTKSMRELPHLDVYSNMIGHNPISSSQLDAKMHIEKVLHQLPTLQRSVVILRHIEGFSTKQVANILRCSEGTVKTHLFRGLKKMRTLLDHLKEED
jgi:RNA polymerase sigma-70 factor (ECF subfamily)